MGKEVRNIIVVGGSFAGLTVAHTLLRHTISAVLSTATDKNVHYKVILVSTSTHFYWVVGSPRSLVRPDLIPVDKSTFPIADAFASYPAESFEFILGQANALNLTARTLTVAKKSGGDVTMGYDTLVLATGASSSNPLWSTKYGHQRTIDETKRINKQILGAKTLVIAGGGAAGVETAGEAGYEYGNKKKIILFSGSTRLLLKLRPAIAETAEETLKGFKITVRHNIKIVNNEVTGDGQTKLTLSDGSTMTTDLYIDATGLQPNSQFIPKALLNEQGSVITTPYLRVPEAGPRVYALGSVAAHSDGGILDVWNSIPAIMSNIQFDLSDGKSAKEKAYHRPEKEMQAVPLGRNKGVGAFYGYRIPSLMIWMLKGRHYMLPEAKGVVDGSKYVRSVTG